MDRGKQAANATTESWKTQDYRKRIIKSIMDELAEHNVLSKKFREPDVIQSMKRFEIDAYYSAKTENEYRSLMIEKVKSIGVESQKAADAKNQLRNPSDSETTEGLIQMQEHVYQILQLLKNRHYPLLLELYKSLCRKLQNGASTLNSGEMDTFKQHKSSMEYLFSLFEISKSDITPEMKDRATEVRSVIQMFLKTNDVAKEQQSPNVQPKQTFFRPPSSRAHIVENNILSKEHQAGIQIGSSQRSNVNQLPSLKGPGNDVQQPTFLAQQATGPFGQSIKAPTTSITRPVGKTYPAAQAIGTFGLSIKAPTTSVIRPVGKIYPAAQATGTFCQSIKAPTISVTKPLGQTYPAPQATSTAPPISVTKPLGQTYPTPQETDTFGQTINSPPISVTKPLSQSYPAPQETCTSGQSINVPTTSVIRPVGKTYPAPQATGTFGKSIKAPPISITKPFGKTYPAPQTTGAVGQSIRAPTISATQPFGQTYLAPQAPGAFGKSLSIRTISATELLGSSINNQMISPSPLSNVNQVSEKPTISSEEHSPAEQRLIKVLTSISPEALREAVSEMQEVIRLNDEIPEMFDELQLPNFVMPEEWKICRNFDALAYENPIICPSTDGGFNQFGAFQFGASRHPRIEENTHLLAEEIKEINNRLFECEVIIYEKENSESEFGVYPESLLVKIIYNALTINQDLISQFTSDKKSLIKPLWLLIPASYPSSSLVILDELPVKVSDDLRGLFERAKGKLRISVESMNKPWLVKDIARAWEGCVREAIIDYAEANGGGTFTSMYGGWDVC